MNESWIQILTIVGSNLVIMLIFFGVTISIHNGTREEIRRIQQEIKDFHTKLALQDMVFKMRLCEIEQEKKARE